LKTKGDHWGLYFGIEAGADRQSPKEMQIVGFVATKRQKDTQAEEVGIIE
jgi:hypothetical protein